MILAAHPDVIAAIHPWDELTGCACNDNTFTTWDDHVQQTAETIAALPTHRSWEQRHVNLIDVDGSESLSLGPEFATHNPDAHTALVAWCTRQGLDPNEMPHSAPIFVDRTRNVITYSQHQRGEIVTRHLELASIEPWPDEILALA